MAGGNSVGAGDLAGLSIAITADTSTLNRSLRDAETATGRFTASQERAADALDKAQQAVQGRLNPALRRAMDSYFQLERSMKSSAAATEHGNAMLALAQQRLAAGKISADQYREAVARIERQYLAVNKAGDGYVAGHRMMQAANENATRSTGKFSAAMGQAGFQVADVANQMATGVSAFTAVGMQAGQLLGAFGPLGAVLGGIVTVAGVMAGSMLKAGDASDEFRDTLDSVTGIVDDAITSGRELRGVHEGQATAVGDLARHYAALSETMRGVEAIRLTTEQNKATEALAAQREKVRDLLGDLGPLEEVANRVAEFQTRLNETRTVLGAEPLGGLPDEVKRLQTVLKDFRTAAPGDAEAIGRLAVALNDAAKAGGPFSAEAKKAAEALAEPAKNAVDLAEKLARVEAAQRLLAGTATKADEALLNMGTTSGRTGEKVRTLEDILSDLSDEGRKLERERLDEAFDRINRAVEAGLTPQEKYQRHVEGVRDAMRLAVENGWTPTAEAIERINRGLKEADPEFQAVEKQAAASAENFPACTDTPEFNAIMDEALS